MILRITLVLALLVGLLVGGVVRMTQIVDVRPAGEPRALSTQEQNLSDQLHSHVQYLSAGIGQRNQSKTGTLDQAADYLLSQLKSLGAPVTEETFDARGQTARNLVVDLPGRDPSQGRLVVTAHYDSYLRSPSANATASGVAVLLELVALRLETPSRRPLRAVFLANGEYPFTGTGDSGAARHAKALKASGSRIDLVLCLGSLGSWSDQPGSQRFPFPLKGCYPETGDFLAVFGDSSSKEPARKVAEALGSTGQLAVEAGAVPGWFPGTEPGDDQPYREAGFDAVRISDTGPYRDEGIRTRSDNFGRVDHEQLARVTVALSAALDRIP